MGLVLTGLGVIEVAYLRFRVDLDVHAIRVPLEMGELRQSRHGVEIRRGAHKLTETGAGNLLLLTVNR